MTLLPGLIDAHTHITYHFDENGLFGATGDASPEMTLKYAEDNARRTVEAGFTTVRNLGAGQDVDIRLRDEVKNGKVVGPRMLVSGQPFTPDLLSGSNKAERLAIIRQFVTARIKEGVDVIKIFEGVDQFRRHSGITRRSTSCRRACTSSGIESGRPRPRSSRSYCSRQRRM